MTSHVPRLPIWLDPLIGEAKRRARRRRLLVLLVLVAAVGAATAALELPSGSGPGTGAAAVGPKPVVHVVLEWPPTSVFFNLKSGHRTGGASREEMWLDRKHGRDRIAHTEDGRVVGDEVWTNHFLPTSEAAAVNHVYLSLVSNFRAALGSGAAKLVGRGSFAGHHILWLRLRQLPVPSWRHGRPWPQVSKTDVGVDAHTFKPVILRFRSSRGTSGGYYGQVVEAKAIAYDPADFKSRGPKHPAVPPRPATGFAFGSANPFVPRSIFVRAPWLTAGKRVAGLELRAVTPFTIRRSKHRFYYGAAEPKAVHGLELVYGPPSYKHTPTVPARINVYGKGPRRRTPFTTIYEVSRAARVLPWSSVPAGTINLQSGLTTLGSRVVHTLRIGYLQKHGLYITIRTPDGEHTALQLARSLRTGHR